MLKWVLSLVVGAVITYAVTQTLIYLLGGTSTLNVTIGTTPRKLDPAAEELLKLERENAIREAQRKRDEAREAEARRQAEVRRAELKRQEELARVEAERERLRLEAAKAQEAVEEARRRRREALLAEQRRKEEYAREYRARNGGCDPGWRRQCVTVGPSGGGPQQNIGCACVPAY